MTPVKHEVDLKKLTYNIVSTRNGQLSSVGLVTPIHGGQANWILSPCHLIKSLTQTPYLQLNINNWKIPLGDLNMAIWYRIWSLRFIWGSGVSKCSRYVITRSDITEYYPRSTPPVTEGEHQPLNSQKTPHTSPSRASYGMSIVRIVDKIDHVVTALQFSEIICWFPILKWVAMTWLGP